MNERKWTDFRDKGKEIIESDWFNIALDVASIGAPIVAGPMVASAGKVLPKIGKAIKYTPRVINGLVIIMKIMLSSSIQMGHSLTTVK